MTKFHRVTKASEVKAGRSYIRAFVGPTGLHGVEIVEPLGMPFGTGKRHGRSEAELKVKTREFSEYLGPFQDERYLGDLGVGPAPTTKPQYDEVTPFGTMLIPFTFKAYQRLESLKGTRDFVRAIMGASLSEDQLCLIEARQLGEKESLRSRTPSRSLRALFH